MGRAMTSSLVKEVRSMIRCCLTSIQQRSAQLQRKLGKSGEDWETALQRDELGFWERALMDPNRNWLQSEFKERTDTELEVQPFIKKLVDAPPGSRVRLLDVGAGPLTRLGKKWEGRSVEIVPVDP